MKKSLKKLIGQARDFAQGTNHGSEPEALRIALEKRKLVRELQGQGLTRKAAMAEVSRRFSEKK